MRVCMFAPALSPWSFGGVAEHTYQLSRNLTALGCDVHVVCKAVKGEDAHETIEGIHVHRIVSGRGPSWYLSMKSSVLNDFIKEWKFDLFHSQGPCGALMDVDGPLVVTLHGTSAGEAVEVFKDLIDMPRLRILNPRAYAVHVLGVPTTYLPAVLLRSIVKRATKIIAVSESVKQEGQTLLHASPEKIEVVYNGVCKKAHFQTTEQLGYPLIAFVGHLGVRKGLPYLIRALQLVFESNSEAKAVIVGKGPLEPLCRSMAAKLKISDRITFTGLVSEPEKKRWYQQATVCVFPSTYEGFPFVALEALAAGKPVVASSVGGLPEVLHNGINGLLVSPRNPREIADALNLILSDEALARRMSQNAKRMVERNFSWKSIAQKTLDVYRSCLGDIS